MSKIKKIIQNPKTWRRIHATFTIIWFLAVIPTILIWKESVLWVALMSCWANAVGHFGAWQGSRAEDASSNSS